MACDTLDGLSLLAIRVATLFPSTPSSKDFLYSCPEVAKNSGVNNDFIVYSLVVRFPAPTFERFFQRSEKLENPLQPQTSIY